MMPDTQVFRSIPVEYIHIDITMVHPRCSPNAAVTVRGKRRCNGCGHRLTVNGIRPIASRRLPVRTWHLELIDRSRAKRS